MSAIACPDVGLLQAMLEGAVVDDGSLTTHVDECATCRERLERLCSSTPSLAMGLRVAPLEVDPEYMQALQRLLGTGESGQQLGEYRLLGTLGRGGMGTVFRAMHVRLEKQVALKLVGADRGHDPALRARFSREIKAAGRLQHRHVVQATDAGEVDGVPYLVMELFEGSIDLARLVKSRGPLPIAEACAAAMQASAGLQAAHDQGLIHRDVKPSNLLLTRDGTIKLLDLGLALLDDSDTPLDVEVAAEATNPGTDGLTSASLVLGTKEYMAPEQRRDSHRIDPRADVFGLGKTLCCLLTGTPAPLNLRGLPRGLQAVITRMLAGVPEERYATATEVGLALAPWARGADLVRLLSGQAIRSRRRLPSWLAVVGLFAGSLGGLLWLLQPTPAIERDTASVSEEQPLVPGRLPMAPDEADALQRRWAASVGHPVDFAPPIGPRLRLVPPGEFGLSGEFRVRITKPYYLGTNEVTRGEYAAFVAETGYTTLPERTGRGACVVHYELINGLKYHTQATKPEFTWKTPGHMTVSDRHPMNCLGWVDSVAYCDWLSKKTGAAYRLPSEAEWKWACRSGEANPVPADEMSLGWSSRNSLEPQPVGTRKPNSWGFFDLIGNVGEHCLDGMMPYPVGAIDDYVAPPNNPLRSRVYASSSYMNFGSPYDHRFPVSPSTGASSAVGFRVLRELPK